MMYFALMVQKLQHSMYTFALSLKGKAKLCQYFKFIDNILIPFTYHTVFTLINARGADIYFSDVTLNFSDLLK